jgi:archaellum biogenesis ATPase FlaH
MSEIKDYSEEVQELFLRFLVTDPEVFVRVNSIVEPYMFSRKYRDAVQFLKDHAGKYNTIPTIEQLDAVNGVKLEPVEGANENHLKWFMAEFETFCRHKALEKAILDSTDLLEKQDYGSVENMIKEASQIGLVTDFGLDYYEDPKGRLEWIKNQAGAISTGWKKFDQKLYGGLNRGELTVFAGGSGAGKSLFLQNLGVNWSQAGLNVVYLSLELSEQLCSMRIDAMVSQYPTRDVMKNMDDVDLKVRMKGKGAGKFRIKQLPNGITANDIRAFLREYEIQTGVKVDALLVDYLDLMMPNSQKVSPSDLFIKDKYVSEELRNIASDLNILLVTASQLNRGAVEEIEFDHSHIAGGISKIQTSDNVIGIFTSNAMRERGRYQVQFMKTRSSSGVGSKVDLKFDPETLRIEDLPEDEEEYDTIQTITMTEQLKRTASIRTEDPDKEDNDIDQTKLQGLALRDLLKKK